MKASTEVGKLFAALSAAQGQITGAVKDSANPFFKSTYADLASVWAACRTPLSANGLAVVQVPRAAGKSITVETILGHASGEWISDELTSEAKDATPQSVGSTITYLRRYALSALVGIAPEDDDGEAAQGRTPAQRSAPAPRPARTPELDAAVKRAVARVVGPTTAAAQTIEQTPPSPSPAEPPHDPQTGEVSLSVAEKLRTRIDAAVNVRPALVDLGAEVAQAAERGAITQEERLSLGQQIKARQMALAQGVAA